MAKACFHFMRVILVIISLLFMLLGLAIVALALFVKLASPIDKLFNDNNNNVGQLINISLYILIGLGAFMAIFGFIGCFGACRKSTVCLSIYITILLIIILGEIGLGVFLVIQTATLTTRTDKLIDGLVEESKKKDGADLFALRWIQEKLKCCGANGPTDYNTGKIPSSCCSDSGVASYGGTVTCQVVTANTRNGCKKEYKKYFSSTGFPILIGVVLGIAVVEFIGIAFAIAICCHSRRHDAGYVSVVT